MSFRKLNIDCPSGDEEGPDAASSSGLVSSSASTAPAQPAAAALASATSRAAEMAQLCARGGARDALLRALDEPPFGDSKDLAPAKDLLTRAVVDALQAIKGPEIVATLKKLSPEHVSVLHKYVYRGMDTCASSSSSSSLLAWHEKIVENAGVGSIVRCVADGRRM